MHMPPIISVGQCMKLYILEKAMARARMIAGMPTLLSINRSDTEPVIPFMVCPEGKDESKGIFTVRLYISTNT